MPEMARMLGVSRSVVYNTIACSDILKTIELDGRRRVTKELFEQAFYEKKNLDPSMHANVAGKTVELPTNVDAELLAKVLSNPEMAALLSTLAKSLESK